MSIFLVVSLFLRSTKIHFGNSLLRRLVLEKILFFLLLSLIQKTSIMCSFFLIFYFIHLITGEGDLLTGRDLYAVCFVTNKFSLLVVIFSIYIFSEALCGLYTIADCFWEHSNATPYGSSSWCHGKDHLHSSSRPIFLEGLSFKLIFFCISSSIFVWTSLFIFF